MVFSSRARSLKIVVPGEESVTYYLGEFHVNLDGEIRVWLERSKSQCSGDTSNGANQLQSRLGCGCESYHLVPSLGTGDSI